MKKLLTSIIALALPMIAFAQGWPAGYGGVMLQGFSWGSYTDTRWANLDKQADELSQYFDLIWLPQSGFTGGSSMGYDPQYFFNQKCTFGTEEQLRALIAKLKANGTGCIADIVINHHKPLAGWLTFAQETYNGMTYQLKSTDVCKDDDGGETYTWAQKNGFTLSSNNDTGEGWDGMRDLDHKSTNVQTIVKAYLKFMLEDMGYVGFRYDMARGFSPYYFGMYNAYAKPTFSVGEHWTNSTSEIDWMNGTRFNDQIQSGVFDFDFRYTCRNAFNNGNMGSLNQPNGNDNNWPLVSNSDQGYLFGGFYRRYAVTFLENHDLQDRGNVENYNADPLKKDTVAANAYMMAMPGTPCVFLTHWKDCKQDIKGLIDVRKAVGITNTSTYNILKQAYNCYAIETNGSDNKKLITVVGGKPYNYDAGNYYVLIVDGYHYRYFMSRNCETAWIDKASGYYNRAQNVTMTAVSQSSNAQLVYTTDGTEPSATNGTKVASGYVLRLREPMTLKVGLLVNNTIKNVQTRVYDLPELPEFQPHTATVYFRDPSVTVPTWTKPYIWPYDGTGNMSTAPWPGSFPMTDSVMIKNKKYYYKSFDINDEDYSFSFVLTNVTGSPQTVDVTNVTKDIYVQLGPLNGLGNYTLTDITKMVEKDNPLNWMKGDINGDKIIDVEDVNAMINVILKIKSISDYPGNADMDDNGYLDVEDVNAVINIILKL
ncbi:MAG: chitobiase/beta-hexosaminidase C-terminal domain-containing protein [Muribaculaceae bacterium]|nr:chitobiase/beta-hexosaminidase C-terminal domain-containing protein [Muribaculaceae bacterium]